jgi:hypothetical protein
MRLRDEAIVRRDRDPCKHGIRVPGGLFLLRSSALQRIQRQLAEMLLSLKPHLGD